MSYLDILKERTNIISCASDDEWHKARKLSSTRASAILGSNPYMSNVDVWELMMGKRQEKFVGDNDNVRFGLDAEQHIRALFRLESKNKYEVIDPMPHREVYAHKEKPYLTCSTDGFVIDKASNELGVLETKTAMIKSSKKHEEWQFHIPEEYYIQLKHEMMVCGADFGLLVAYLRYTDYSIMKVYKIVRNADLQKEIDELFNQEVLFYEEYISKGKKPPLVINL